ncbi:MAG: ABC transporter substrate-binding protein [Dehalococcoidia bacterium]
MNVKEDRSLASKWEVPDPLTVVFTLRSGVKFHDGTDFNASAVVANYEHVVNDGARSGAVADLQAVDRVEAVDPITAIFHMKRPDGGLFTKLGDRPGFQNSPTALMKYGSSFANGDYKRNPVGTGAFKFKGWQEGSFIQVEKFDGYWQAGHPNIQGVDWRVIPDPNTAFAAFRTGDLDVLWGLDSKNMKTVKDMSGVTFAQQAGVSIPSFMLNTARPPFNNPHAGRAVSYAINRQAIVDALFNGTARKAATWIGPGNAEFDPNYQGLWFDEAKARSELSVGGLTDGFEFMITGSENPKDAEMLQAVQAQLAKFKIKMTVEFNKDFVARFRDDHIGDGFYSAYSGRAEPSQSFNFKDAASGVYASGGAKATDDKFETMLADLESTLDFEARRKKLYELADRVNELGWDVFLWHPDTLVAHYDTLAFEVFGDGKPHLGQGDVTAYAS